MEPRSFISSCLAAARGADVARRCVRCVVSVSWWPCHAAVERPEAGRMNRVERVKLCIPFATAVGTDECVSARRAWASKRENLLAHVQK